MFQFAKCSRFGVFLKFGRKKRPKEQNSLMNPSRLCLLSIGCPGFSPHVQPPGALSVFQHHLIQPHNTSSEPGKCEHLHVTGYHHSRHWCFPALPARVCSGSGVGCRMVLPVLTGTPHHLLTPLCEPDVQLALGSLLDLPWLALNRLLWVGLPPAPAPGWALLWEHCISPLNAQQGTGFSLSTVQCYLVKLFSKLILVLVLLRGRLTFPQAKWWGGAFSCTGCCRTSTVLVCLMVTMSLSIPQLLSSYSLTQWKVNWQQKNIFWLCNSFSYFTVEWFVLRGSVERWEIQCCQVPLVLQITSISSLLLFQKILVRYLWRRAWQRLVSAARAPIPWKHGGLVLPEGREGNHPLHLHAQMGASNSHFKFLYIYLNPRKWFGYYIKHMYGK